MHGHHDLSVFLNGMAGFLGSYYIAIACMNATAALYLWRSGKEQKLFKIPGTDLHFTTSLLWLVVALVFVFIAPLAMSGNPSVMAWVSIPVVLRNLLDALMNPVVYTIGSLVLLGLAFVFRRFLVQPIVAWAGLNLSLLFMGLSMTDPDFASIVTKPDNVPIVGLIYLLGFFTWLATWYAVQNDQRAKDGLPPLESLDDEKVLVWPDLVYSELICMVALTAFMIVWAILLKAPLEEPASSVKTPNPSKAPWYFLGLQEMLVYFDPWMAGVVLPSVVVAGLMAIPYIDFNKEGNGYYTIEKRTFAYLMFQFGFLVLWVTLIIMGTFLRGPNWNFFGIYETWDPHKVEALNNVDLSEYVWIWMLNMPRPEAPPDSGTLTIIWHVIQREFVGILLLIGYFAAIPPLLIVLPGMISKRFDFFRNMFIRMGFIRYLVLTNLLLLMMLLPIKMVARWTLNMKYFIFVKEYMLNF